MILFLLHMFFSHSKIRSFAFNKWISVCTKLRKPKVSKHQPFIIIGTHIQKPKLLSKLFDIVTLRKLKTLKNIVQ